MRVHLRLQSQKLRFLQQPLRVHLLLAGCDQAAQIPLHPVHRRGQIVKLFAGGNLNIRALKIALGNLPHAAHQLPDRRVNPRVEIHGKGYRRQ
ncbi:hypothetical protein SDC9_84217 [bioreactor metagenome]|uniref:Uncharacterized protein n=1 Tax=bioreactor metagenome TaxID=1076179 RepID=A0A644ZA75_9ZZZZ